MARFPKVCLVCDKLCASKKEWMGHLLQPEHSDKAKEQCHFWGSEVKQCSLVVCGKYPLARNSILEYFSGGEGFVVDFVCDVSRPLHGIIRFQNQLMVEQLVKIMGSEVDIDGAKFELRKAKGMPAAEWQAVLPEPSAMMSATSADLSKDSGNDIVKRISNLKLDKDRIGEMQVKMVEQGSAPNLVNQYVVLCSEVEIPAQKSQRVFELIDRIRNAIQKHDPRAWVNYFRHQYLKLLNANSNLLLICVSQANAQPLDLDIERILETISIKPLPSKYQQTVEAGHRYRDEQNGLWFEVVTEAHYHAEVITCQWAEYLLRFDPRARSLLTLINYWARENRVTLAEDRIEQQNIFDPIPDPAALEWLCIFFLCKNKILPTPLEVLDRPGSKPKLESTGRHLLAPIAPRKSDFVKVWRAEHKKDVPKEGSKAYVLDVLRLTREFFQFYTSRNFKGTVLKTNDAEVISSKSAFVSGLMKKPPSKSEETMAQAQKNQETMLEEREKKIILMQPFVPGGRFSICQNKFEDKIQPFMRLAVGKLGFYLENQEYQGKRILEVELKSLFGPGEFQIYGPPKVPVDLCLDLDDEELEVDRHQELTYLQCGCKPTGSTCNGNNFSCHFSSVLGAMLMSEKEEKRITAANKKLNELFEAFGLEDSQVILFRGCRFSLSHFVEDSTVYFFLDHPGLYSERYGQRVMLPVGANEREEVIARIESKGEYFKKLSQLLLAPFGEVTRVILGNKEEFVTFHEPKLELNFSIASDFYLVEVQTHRLAEYFCTFDRRVKPVMTLILYWAKKNGIQLGKGGPARVGFAPDPALLEWLVLYFLHNKEIVPTPKYIYDLHPEEKLIFDMDDIGFTVDPQHAQDWSDFYQERSKEKTVSEVYLLVWQFFDFWGEIGELAKARPMVIDLKNFRSFSKDKMDEAKDAFDFDVLSRGTGIETFQLKLINSQRLIRESFHSRSEALTFLHPLHVRYGFSFCSGTFLESVCPKMRGKGRKACLSVD